ncbi:MAG: replicative DNA helicase, partial [Calditrichia bacterium]
MARKKNDKPVSDEILEQAGRMPPQAVEVEQYVLCAMLLDREAVAIALEHLDETDFYKDIHRQIFMAMVSLYEKDDVVDIITLSAELERMKLLEKIGGIGYLTELASVVPSSANIEYHMKIIREKALLRKLIHASNDILKNCYSAEEEVEKILSNAQQAVFDILKTQKQKSYQVIKPILDETFAEIERLHHLDHTGVIGVPSGFIALDDITAGFQRGDL